MTLTAQWRAVATKMTKKARSVSFVSEAEQLEFGRALMTGAAEGEWRLKSRGQWVFYVRLRHVGSVAGGPAQQLEFGQLL